MGNAKNYSNQMSNVFKSANTNAEENIKRHEENLKTIELEKEKEVVVVPEILDEE